MVVTNVIVALEVADTFMPTAGVVGLLPMVTYFFMVVTMFAFLGSFIFTLTTHTSVSSAYRTTHLLTAIIAAVAGLSYWAIQHDYHSVLSEIATVSDPGNQQTLIRQSYNAISPYRYMDWAVTTPLLLIQMVLVLSRKIAVIKRPLITLLLADFAMILTGFIGEQQLSFSNELETGPKLVWGAVATVGYVLIPYTLYKLWQTVGSQATLAEQRAYRLMALTTVTSWGIYPIGYILTVTNLDVNLIHISYSVADIINKIGVGLVIYFLAAKPLE